MVCEEKSDSNKPSPRLFILSALLFLSLILLPNASAVLNDSVLYYSFENQPSTAIVDQTGINGYASEYGDGAELGPTTSSKVGSWAYYFQLDDAAYLSGPITASMLSDDYASGAGNLSTNITINYWVKHPKNTISGGVTSHFSIGNIISGNVDDTNEEYDIRIYDRNSGLFALCRYDISTDYTWNDWNNIFYTIDPSIGYSWCPTITVNDVDLTLAGGGGTGGTTINGGISNVTLRRTSLYDSKGENISIDEFGVWNRSLSASEQDQLWNGGLGYDPFSTDPPIQIASIATVDIGTFSQETRDYGDFFNGETNISIFFDYELTSYEGYFGVASTINTPDFAAQFDDLDSVTWYSYGSQVTATPFTISACNPNGCTNVTSSFTVSGFGSPTPIASIDDWNMGYTTEYRRTFSDYFGGYTRRFIQYIDPDDGVTLTNVTTNQSDDNSCFTAQVVGDQAIITTKQVNCVVEVVFITDNMVVSAQSNYFDIIIDDSLETRANSFWRDALSIFPDSETLTIQAKLGIIVMSMLFSIIVLGLMYANTNDKAQLFIVMMGSLLLGVELFFFTALGYIAYWITFIIVMMVVFLTVSLGYKMIRPNGGF